VVSQPDLDLGEVQADLAFQKKLYAVVMKDLDRALKQRNEAQEELKKEKAAQVLFGASLANTEIELEQALSERDALITERTSYTKTYTESINQRDALITERTSLKSEVDRWSRMYGSARDDYLEQVEQNRILSNRLTAELARNQSYTKTYTESINHEQRKNKVMSDAQAYTEKELKRVQKELSATLAEKAEPIGTRAEKAIEQWRNMYHNACRNTDVLTDENKQLKERIAAAFDALGT
jgi:chromosome segregation ATPase